MTLLEESWLKDFYEKNRLALWTVNCTSFKLLKRILYRKKPYVQKDKKRTKNEIEKIIASDPDWAYKYVCFLLLKPFPLGEPAIATVPYMAVSYARNILGKKFPLGEPIIATDARASYGYALSLRAPFPAGEPMIATNKNYSFGYASYVLKGPFPAGEPMIARDPALSCLYALDILKDRFILGELAISTVMCTKDKYYLRFGVKL